MKKKLQVFISSTFEDLKEERQVAVESVLNAGHIPAGMELFKSDDKSQKEIIKRWIDESDVYMLILGGRYGSIDEETGLSYTHWEYNYAGEVGKPRFAVVIDEGALEEKVKILGTSIMERANVSKYEDFKKDVLSKMCKFYTDTRDIKLTVLESLKEFESNEKLTGWISGKDVKGNEDIKEKYALLLEKYNDISEKLAALKEVKKEERLFDGIPFNELREILKSKVIVIPKETDGTELEKDWETNVHVLFSRVRSAFAVGISSNGHMVEVNRILFYQVAPHLMQYGLIDKVKLTGSNFHKMQTSKDGMRYLKYIDIEKRAKEALKVAALEESE